ncbi:hypothetical protein DYB34_001705 [Aphanomyces astaci]|uniref:Uncharacterized protein n=2 Tax=Aphanomyces astaci TaxID=112090 RepID=A0A3R6WNF9_APHAT|nr:hypothetical protein DYB34_001705 [Aphanomyces astaci]
MQVLTLGLVGAIICLWFTFDAGISIFIMLVMFLLVSYVANRVLLESSPAHFHDIDVDHDEDVIFDDEYEEGVVKSAPKRSPAGEKQSWNVPALHIRELVMPSTTSQLRKDTLQVGQELWPNSDTPVEIENEYFSGRILFLLKTEPRSPTWGQLFVGRRRLFWIQLQGKFKKQPQGIVYVGGEIPNKMKLGFFAKGLCRVLLSVINCLVVGLHNSFGRLYPGDVAAVDDEELPHLAFPLHSSVDEFICTPAGEDPPALGADGFMETREERAHRRSGKHPYEFNTHDTYSFSFFNFYLDFENWKVVNAPGVPDIHLAQFWGNMPLRIVSYSLAQPSPRHTRALKLYHFCFELTPPTSQLDSSLMRTASASAADVAAIDVDAEELEFLRDEQNAHTQLANELSCFVFTVPAWLEYFSTHDSAKGPGQRRVAYVFDILEYADSSRTRLKRHHIAIHGASQSHMPLTLANEHPTGDAFGKQFEFTVESKLESGAAIEKERVDMESRLVEISRDRIMATDTDCQNQWRRRSIAHLIAAKNQLKRLLTSPSTVLPYAPFFAARGLVANATQCHVVRMVRDSHWRNEWMILDTGKSKALRFFRMSSSTACVTIHVADILALSSAAALNLPATGNCNGMHWFQIETLARVHVVAVASYQEFEFWTSALAGEVDKVVADGKDVLARSVLGQPFRSIATTLGKVRHPKDVFAPTHDGRIMLNDRRIAARFGQHPSSTSTDLKRFADVCGIAEKALRMVLVLTKHPTVCLTSEVLTFLDMVSSLKRTVPLLASMQSAPPAAHRTAFFLNVYHILVLHGSFLELLPTIKPKLHWSSFYHGVSYDIAGMSLTPAEIDHAIVRASLCPLKPPFPAFVVPRFADDDPRSALKLPTADYRLDFALNCLTKSCVQVIAVFRGDDLDRQLDYICRVVLSTLMSTDSKRHVIYLPRICEWYHADFPGDDQVLSKVTTLASHLDGDIKRAVDALLSHPTKLSIKYLKYDYGYHNTIYLTGNE